MSDKVVDLRATAVKPGLEKPVTPITPVPAAAVVEPKAVVVDVQSAWASKINWTQVISGGAMLVGWATGNQLQLDANQQASIVVVIGLLTNVVTWVMRTWFTASVVKNSVK